MKRWTMVSQAMRVRANALREPSSAPRVVTDRESYLRIVSTKAQRSEARKAERRARKAAAQAARGIVTD